MGSVLVVNRFRIAAEETESFQADLAAARDLLSAQRGYVDGILGRNLDDPELWVMVTRWESVGAYRRALSAYDVRLHAHPTLGRALDEPGAFEDAEPGATLNVGSPRSLG